MAGQTAGQKLIWKKRFGESPWEVENSYERQKWYHMSSPGDLTSVYWLHCGKIIDKSKRDLFVTGDTDIIRKHFQVKHSALPTARCMYCIVGVDAVLLQ